MKSSQKYEQGTWATDLTDVIVKELQVASKHVTWFIATKKTQTKPEREPLEHLKFKGPKGPAVGHEAWGRPHHRWQLVELFQQGCSYPSSRTHNPRVFPAKLMQVRSKGEHHPLACTAHTPRGTRSRRPEGTVPEALSLGIKGTPWGGTCLQKTPEGSASEKQCRGTSGSLFRPPPSWRYVVWYPRLCALSPCRSLPDCHSLCAAPHSPPATATVSVSAHRQRAPPPRRQFRVPALGPRVVCTHQYPAAPKPVSWAPLSSLELTRSHCKRQGNPPGVRVPPTSELESCEGSCGLHCADHTEASRKVGGSTHGQGPAP